MPNSQLCWLHHGSPALLQRFLIDLLESEAFRSGETYTTTVEGMTFERPEIPEALVALANQELDRRVASATTSSDADAFAPWDRLGAFRMGEG